MHTYPILLDIRQLRVVVVGAGAVGLRKIHGLLEAGPPATLLVVEPSPTSQLLELEHRHPSMTLITRPFVADDLRNAQLVFACTSSAEVNARVATLCQAAGVLCNCAQHPQMGNFTLPACVRRGDLILAVATSGASPALARAVRQRLEADFGPEYGALTCLLARLRPYVLALEEDTACHTEIFRTMVASPLLTALRHKDHDQCVCLLRDILPPALHPHVEELCHACLDMV